MQISTRMAELLSIFAQQAEEETKTDNLIEVLCVCEQPIDGGRYVVHGTQQRHLPALVPLQNRHTACHLRGV